jgi:hypothetical protein
MSRSSILNKLGGLAQVSLWAGLFLLVSIGSGAQAATVNAYTNQAAWAADPLNTGPILSEDFTDGTLIPQLSITFGTSPGNAANAALVGNISGGLYNDRADDSNPLYNATFATPPVLNFNGLGVAAFGGDWDLGPNTPGTGIKLHITFVDNSEMDLATEILNPASNAGYVGFFGIVSDMAIKSIRIDEATAQQFGQAFETFNFDNAQLVSAVPIPAALPLFLSAIAALGFFGRRRIQATA